MSISLGLSTLSTLQELPDDFSPSQPRSNKHHKNNSIKFNEAQSSLLNTTGGDLSYHDLQTKYVMLSAEANRLLTNNQNLSSENQSLEQRCHQAEKLVGRTITVTIDKNLESSQRGQIYELNDKLEMAKSIIVKQNKEIFTLKNNTSIMTAGDEDMWKQKYSDLEIRFDQQAKKYHDLFLKLEKKLNETVETKNELLKESEIQKAEIISLTQQLQTKTQYTELCEDKESLEIQLDSCKIELETSKEEIEMLKREVLRMRQQFLPTTDNSQKQGIVPNLNLQRANNINNFGKRYCLKFLKSIRGDDAVSEIDSFFDEQGKFTTGRFQTSPEQNRNVYTSNNFTTETLQEEEEESSEKRYTSKDMNLLRKELIEYEQIIMFLSEQVKTSSDDNDKKLLDFIQKNNTEIETSRIENKRLLQEIKTCREKISELEIKTLNTQETHQSEETELTIRLQQQIIQLEQDKSNMKEDLKDNLLLIQAYVKENERLQNFISQHKATDHLKIEEYEKTIHKLNQSISVWKSEFQKLEHEKNKLPQVQENKNQYEKAIEILKQKFAHFEKSFDVVAKQNEDLNRKIKSLQEELTSSNQRINELTRENQNLNAVITSKTKEIHDLISKETQDEKMKEKWLHSYSEMEEIVTALESRKETMQNQLNKMREIIESNTEEIFQLSEINQRQELDNQMLVQEIKRLQSSNKSHHLNSHKYY